MDELKDGIRETGDAQAGSIHCLTIVGQIEGHQLLPEDAKATKYEHILPLIAAIEESPEIKGLLILLNTMGGDVEAGLAIAELIAGMKKPTVSLVLGGGHSIGVPLAVAAKEHDRALRRNDHTSREDKRHSYRRAADLQLLLTHAGAHSQLRDGAFLGHEGKYMSLMNNTDELANDVGSVIYGEEAVESGLIDTLGTLSDALRYLHGQINGLSQ